MADAVGVDGLAARVRQQRELDGPPQAKGRQRVLCVVADRNEVDAGLLEVRLSFLQLDQLPLAVRSPACGAKEEQRDVALLPKE